MATHYNTIGNIEFCRAAKNDINGNPRTIVHFMAFLRPEDDCFSTFGGICETYRAVTKRAKAAGFKKYSCREFGGGFICQYDYTNNHEIYNRIMESLSIEL